MENRIISNRHALLLIIKKFSLIYTDRNEEYYFHIFTVEEYNYFVSKSITFSQIHLNDSYPIPNN